MRAALTAYAAAVACALTATWLAWGPAVAALAAVAFTAWVAGDTLVDRATTPRHPHRPPVEDTPAR